MSIKQKVNGVVSDYIIHASDIQLLDVNNNFTSTTVEGALKENVDKIGVLTISGITETDLSTAIKNDRMQLSDIKLQKSNKLQAKSLQAYNNAVHESALQICKACLKQTLYAMRNKTLKVAFFGDSITEGAELVDPSQGYANLIIKNDLTKLTNRGITVTAQNFGLSGRTLAQAISPSYVAVNPEPSNVANGFWRDWSTVGKSWINHIRDFQPDLLIVAFGMNDGNYNGDINEYTNLNTLKTIISGWSKIPDLVFVPNYIPSNDATAIAETGYNVEQQISLAVARTIRQFAITNNYLIADFNRLFRILRDGIDECSFVKHTEEGFTKLGLVGATSKFTITDTSLTPVLPNNQGGAFIYSSTIFTNGIINLTVTNPQTGANGASWIKYRCYTNKQGKERSLAVVIVTGSSGSLLFGYFDDSQNFTTVQQVNMSLNSNSNNIFIQCHNYNHIITINGTQIINTNVYSNLNDGTIVFGSDQVALPTFSGVAVQYETPMEFEPIYTNEDLFGLVTKPANEVLSGNAINHMTNEGQKLVCYESFWGILQNLLNLDLNSNTQNEKILASEWIQTVSPFTPLQTSGGNNLYYIQRPSNFYMDLCDFYNFLDGTKYTYRKCRVWSDLSNLATNEFAIMDSAGGSSSSSNLIFICSTSSPTNIFGINKILK